jgi:putative transposase
LNAHWFMSLDDARQKCEEWRRDYNEERPHSAIGNKTPSELINRSGVIRKLPRTWTTKWSGPSRQ